MTRRSTQNEWAFSRRVYTPARTNIAEQEMDEKNKWQEKHIAVTNLHPISDVTNCRRGGYYGMPLSVLPPSRSGE